MRVNGAAELTRKVPSTMQNNVIMDLCQLGESVSAINILLFNIINNEKGGKKLIYI